jgi:signal transduction histidine kinase
MPSAAETWCGRCCRLREALRASAWRCSQKHLIKEIVKILRETLPKSIEINFKLADNLWLIPADATQVRSGADESLCQCPRRNAQGGSISIRAENVFVDENYARMHLEAKPGRFVVITVSDSGPGMTAEIQSRIFEPFFTTKDAFHGRAGNDSCVAKNEPRCAHHRREWAGHGTACGRGRARGRLSVS